ncbi:hypothetical protein ACVWWN_003950 [Mycobacterium sp. URHB0021]|jgi:hypothetical protein
MEYSTRWTYAVQPRVPLSGTVVRPDHNRKRRLGSIPMMWLQCELPLSFALSRLHAGSFTARIKWNLGIVPAGQRL